MIYFFITAISICIENDKLLVFSSCFFYGTKYLHGMFVGVPAQKFKCKKKSCILCILLFAASGGFRWVYPTGLESYSAIIFFTLCLFFIWECLILCAGFQISFLHSIFFYIKKTFLSFFFPFSISDMGFAHNIHGIWKHTCSNEIIHIMRSLWEMMVSNWDFMSLDPETFLDTHCQRIFTKCYVYAGRDRERDDFVLMGCVNAMTNPIWCMPIWTIDNFILWLQNTEHPPYMVPENLSSLASVLQAITFCQEIMQIDSLFHHFYEYFLGS